MTAAAAGAGFVGLLSLFNLLGRFFWSSASDKLGRKVAYAIYFALGMVLYALIPTLGHNAAADAVRGGGLRDYQHVRRRLCHGIPAYLSDLFGKYQVGAIHGRLLTAWSTAGVVGPLITNYLHESRKAAGFTGAAAYQTVFYTMAGVLVVGLLANFAVTAVNEKYFEKGPVTPQGGGH